MLEKMSANEVFEQWVKEGHKISFWGASEQSLTEIRRFIRNVETLWEGIKWGCIYDNYPSKEYAVFQNVKMEILNGNQYNDENTKLILCITKRQSYHEVAREMETTNAVCGKDYLDIFEFKFEGAKENPYEQIVPYATYAPWREEEDFISILEKVKIIHWWIYIDCILYG